MALKRLCVAAYTTPERKFLACGRVVYVQRTLAATQLCHTWPGLQGEFFNAKNLNRSASFCTGHGGILSLGVLTQR